VQVQAADQKVTAAPTVRFNTIAVDDYFQQYLPFASAAPVATQPAEAASTEAPAAEVPR
jgi:hypothetical protein